MLPSIRKPTPFDVTRLFFLGAIWGGAFLFITLALVDFDPVSLAAWRVFLGAVVMVGIARLTASRFPRELRDWRYMFAIGCLNSAAPFFLISWGQQYISSAASALLMATGTFCTVVVSHFTSDDERINRLRLAGVLIGFSGVFVLVFWGIMESGLGGLKGQIAVVIAGCCYSISSIISRRVSHLPSISISVGTMVSASLYMVPLAFLLGDPLPDDVSIQSILSLVYLGVIATAMAMTIRFSIIRNNGAIFISQAGYLVPLFGVIWSGLYFADAINMQTIIALSLILVGIAVTRKGG
ncbi:MAG: drug/metabolite transporter (DMT)-like permease [Oceanospirillaceae bacterium]|jgi:drug/metabolite transporter (DMT)-like permease